jgi:hypothetical protein
VPPALVAYVSWLAPIGDPGADRTAAAARDFTCMWTAGRLALHGGLPALFDRAAFNAALQSLFGAGFPSQVWSYPPPGLLLAALVSVFPFVPGFLLWTGATLAALWAALRAGGLAPRVAAAVILSPAAFDNALTGQNGALVAALLLGGLMLARARPAIAGLLLGALIIKPQFGLLVPVALLASRNGRAFGFAALSAAALSLLAGAAFGFDTWTAFFARTQPTLAAMLAEPWQAVLGHGIFASPLAAARSLGASLSAAELAQHAVTVIAAIVTWRAWRSPGAAPLPRVALTAALALLAAPWTHTYDMVALASAVAVLAATARASLPVLAFAWFWPGAAVLVPIPISLEVASIVGVAWMAWRRR